MKNRNGPMLQLDGPSERVKGEKKNATRVEAKIVFLKVLNFIE